MDLDLEAFAGQREQTYQPQALNLSIVVTFEVGPRPRCFIEVRTFHFKFAFIFSRDRVTLERQHWKIVLGKG